MLLQAAKCIGAEAATNGLAEAGISIETVFKALEVWPYGNNKNK